MTLLAIDGRFVNQKLAYLPKGYHCVAHLDNHPDIISCHPEYMSKNFIADMSEGLETYCDKDTALRFINSLRHGSLSVMAIQVLACIVSVNGEIYFAQREARNVK
jgi:hypothetical protein